MVLRVFAELAMSCPGLRLVFVGPDRGVKTVDGRVQSFEPFVQNVVPQHIHPRIKFLGQLSSEEVAALRPRSFVTLIASQQEMMPYSVLEAMSVGCPIVATAVGGIPELIRDRSNGLLVPPGGVKEMVRACWELLGDRAFAMRLGYQAWQDCSNLYAPDRIARQTITAYQEAIDAFELRRR